LNYIEHSYGKCYGNGPFIDYKNHHLPIESAFLSFLLPNGHILGNSCAEGGASCKMPQHGELRVDSTILFQ
jgi:hypothetical protein